MKRALLALTIAMASSASGSRLRDPTGIPSPTFGIPQDTFISAGCEAYIFGRLVPPIERDGQWGHWVRKDSRQVCVNDVVLVDVSVASPERPDSTYPAEVKRAVALSRYFQAMIASDASYAGDDEFAMYCGEQVPLEKPMLLCYTAEGDAVTVTFYKESFRLWIGQNGIVIPWHVHAGPPMPPEIMNERTLDLTYHGICSTLGRGGMVLINGSVTRLLCSPRCSDAERELVRTRIAQIPKLARVFGTDWDGRPNYDFLYFGDDDDRFSPSEVRAFVEAAHAR